MNFFEFYNIPISFQVDKAALKRTFYANSKKYHPDFYTLESEERQAEVLELASKNNEAYRVLSDFDKRMKYILDLEGILEKEGENKIPQDFLMEMMDINEEMMELEFEYNPVTLEKIKSALSTQEESLFADIEPIVKEYDSSKLEEVKNYYLKKRYLLRIRENLNKFASR
ncbi:MAG: Fe-S protein assembly co-chaperone HscB [Bacteroidota bacterium]